MVAHFLVTEAEEVKERREGTMKGSRGEKECVRGEEHEVQRVKE